MPVFPRHARYGAHSGLVNPHFLQRSLLEDAFLRPLERFRTRISALIFEFGAIVGQTLTPGEFAAALKNLFGKLPSTFHYAVEIRNPEFLVHPEYRAVSSNTK